MVIQEIDNNGMLLSNIEEEPEIIDIGIRPLNGSSLKRGQTYDVTSNNLRRKPHKIKQGQQKPYKVINNYLTDPKSTECKDY